MRISEMSLTWLSSVNATPTCEQNSSWPVSVGVCVEWPCVQHPLFQASIILLLVASLLPQRRRYSFVGSRLLLAAAGLLLAGWAAAVVCSLDTLMWNCVFIAVNSLYALHALRDACRRRPRALLRELYRRVYEPLGVDCKHFHSLTSMATVHRLSAGEHFCVENKTKLSRTISVLLSGKLQVRCREVHLHYVRPCELIDSLEWEACCSLSEGDRLVDASGLDNVIPGHYYQVTATACDESVYLTLDKHHTATLLESNDYLNAILHNIVGKDVTQKLYRVTEEREPGTEDDSYLPTGSPLKKTATKLQRSPAKIDPILPVYESVTSASNNATEVVQMAPAASTDDCTVTVRSLPPSGSCWI